MKNTLIFRLGLAALLASAAVGGARAATITFKGTLSDAILGGTSVSGQFGFDFTTDAVTSFKFTVPGGSFDSSVDNSVFVTPFTSSGTSYLDIRFFNSTPSSLDLVVNPTITEFFTQSLPVDGHPTLIFSSNYFCSGSPCFDKGSDFASGTVTTGVVPEPSTWALMALGFAGLGYAGWRSRRGSVAIA
jgi:hypothetical protein